MYFHAVNTYIGPCDFPKTFELGNFRTDNAFGEVHGECAVLKWHGLRWAPSW